MQPITAIAEKAGILEDELELYGRYKAKIDYGGPRPPQGQAGRQDTSTSRPSRRRRWARARPSRPSASPGPERHRQARHAALCASRRWARSSASRAAPPAAATRQVIPMEDFNLHLTGDIHAVGAANNLLAAFVDNHIMHGNAARTSTRSRIPWRRVRRHQRPRAARDRHRPRRPAQRPTRARPASTSPWPARSWPSSPSRPTCKDLRERLGRIVVRLRATTGKPVTAEDLGVAGAMTVLLKDAIKPNLVQTLEGSAALRPRGPVRQHRPRQQLDPRRPVGPEAQRLRRHRERLRRRHGRREVHRHQVPLRRASRPSAVVMVGHHARAQDARRRAAGRRRQAARPGLHEEQRRALAEGLRATSPSRSRT